MTPPAPLQVQTPVLEIACVAWGDPGGRPVILAHGFPYDALAFAEVGPILAAQGFRVIAPWQRGYGGTRFRDPAAMRSGEQAAIGRDIVALVDALGLERPIVGGFDWGARAACVAAVLAPAKLGGVVPVGGYQVQDLADASRPAPAAIEHRTWHQFYLASERGQRALTERRDDLTAELWHQWSPHWAFTPETLAATTAAFANPDFAAVVAHSYRHRIGAAAGDPAYADDQARLLGRPAIGVPALVVNGGDDPFVGGTDAFADLVAVHTLPGIGHNPPQEAPAAFAAAICTLAEAIRMRG